MQISLITPNERMSQTFKEAFHNYDMDLQLYVSVDDCPNIAEFDVCLVDISDKKAHLALKKLKNVAYFAINDDIELENDIFSGIYKKPIRIGSIIHDIQHYLFKNKQLSALKPVKMGKFTLNPRENTLINENHSKSFKLTEKEQDILLFLYDHRSEGVTKQGLLDGVWGYAQGVETHTLETHIYRLRQKIEPDPANPEFLVTDGEGYRLNF